MPSPVKFSTTIYVHNGSNIPLWVKVKGQSAVSEWSFQEKNLGKLDPASGATYALTDWATRTLPSSETEEQIKMIVEAYKDSGYSELYGVLEKIITAKFIDSDLFTVIDEYDFDDGTAQGWSLEVVKEQSDETVTRTTSIAGDYYVSSPYSYKIYVQSPENPAMRGARYLETDYRLYKTVTVPSGYTEYYVMVYLRTYLRMNSCSYASGPGHWVKGLVGYYVLLDVSYKFNNPKFYYYYYYEPSSTSYLAREISIGWFKLVSPISSGSVTLKIGLKGKTEGHNSYTGCTQKVTHWIDNIKVIAR